MAEDGYRVQPSAHEARPEVQMPGQVIYGEDHPGMRWQMVTIASLCWATLIVGGVAMNLPHPEGFGVLVLAAGLIGAFNTVTRSITRAVGVRVYENSIQIGGLRGRDRSLQRGTWPPQKLNAGLARKAVFICPWPAADGLYVLTKRSEIKRLRQDAALYLRSTRGARTPLGFFSGAVISANAVLVISNDPRRTESEPRELDPVRGRNGTVYPVRSPAWMVPIRDPAAFRAAVQRLPQAPPVYDRLPEGHVRFEIS
jgi:hypothetical protein